MRSGSEAPPPTTLGGPVGLTPSCSEATFHAASSGARDRARLGLACARCQPSTGAKEPPRPLAIWALLATGRPGVGNPQRQGVACRQKHIFHSLLWKVDHRPGLSGPSERGMLSDERQPQHGQVWLRGDSLRGWQRGALGPRGGSGLDAPWARLAAGLPWELCGATRGLQQWGVTEWSPEAGGRVVCAPDVRRWERATPTRRLPGRWWPRPGFGGGVCLRAALAWGQACDLGEGQAEVVAAVPTPRPVPPTRRRLLGVPCVPWVSWTLLFFEETEDYIFYREQAVFLIFVSFFRCNFYLCSSPNLLVWVKPGGLARVLLLGGPRSRTPRPRPRSQGAALPGGRADQPDEAHSPPGR